MVYRKLGRSAYNASEIGLGCEHLQGKDYATVKAVIDEALAHGVNILDIFMSEPQVRTDIGKAIKDVRAQVIVQGHIGAVWRDGQYARSRDAAECKFFFEDLLTRLQTDYMDIGMIHFVDTEADYDGVFNTEVIGYVQSLKQQNIVRMVGLSSHNPLIARKAVETGLIDVLMFSLNPAYDLMPGTAGIDDLFTPDMLQKNELSGVNPERAALYQTCVAYGCAITVMKCFCGGMLLNERRSPFGRAIQTLPLLHYALTRPAVASVLVGCATPEEVRKAVAYETASDAEKDFTDILQYAPQYSVQGSCVYCNHCLPCPVKIDIAQVNKYLDLTADDGTAPPTVAAHYEALSAHGGDCLSCGQCEPNCPFGVSIMERMKQAQAVFGK